MARPFRYTLILALVAFGTCLAALSGWRYARVSAPVNGPVVLMSIDALRADRLPAYGYAKGNTPAIDHLAADGIVFEHAYAHVPETLPAHAALLSGRLPFETGIRDGVSAPINASERLLPEMLRDRGYATGGVVSSSLLSRDSGISRGFAFFDDTLPGVAGESTPADTRDGAASERIAERWLDSVGTARAFLFLHLDDIREPHVAPEGVSGETPYDAEVAYVDSVVGRLIAYLKSKNLYEQSTVILVSDHGEGLGDHGEQGHGLFVYDDTLRVPLIIKPPRGSATARRATALVQHADLVPTILDLTKAPLPGGLRGRSLTPLFDTGGSITRTAVYSESRFGERHFGWAPLSTVTDGRYRYIRAPREELYDLDVDPTEQHNIVADEPATTTRLRDILTGLLDAAAAMKAPEPAAHVSVAERERLEGLGYVGVFTESATPRSENIDPKDHWAFVEHYREAARRVAARDWLGAIDCFRALTREEPQSLDVWLRLGVMATRAGRTDQALDAYKQASQLSPANAEARLGVATALLRLRRPDEARLTATRLVEDEAIEAPARSRAHEVLARVALGRRDLETARAEADLAEADDPSRPVHAYVEGRIAVEQKRYADALAVLEPALAATQKSRELNVMDLRLLTAESLAGLERLSEAEYLFLEEMRESPDSARARAGLTAVYRATGRTDEAKALASH